MAVGINLLLDLSYVGEKCSVELGVLWVLQRSVDGTAGGAFAADEV